LNVKFRNFSYPKTRFWVWATAPLPDSTHNLPNSETACDSISGVVNGGSRDNCPPYDWTATKLLLDQ